MERNEGIVILDAGNEEQAMVTSEAFCCFGFFGYYGF